ncbi:MAG TPA: hypothetical protein VEQ42_11250 [Pyrinomonadaceae bacterium]|nr:hypothetical protein [Pyrinomonadaceae bacterium]
MLLVGSATHILFAGLPPVPAYHFTAGNFDAATNETRGDTHDTKRAGGFPSPPAFLVE